MVTRKGQWSELKNIILTLIVIIVLVILIRNYIYAPVSEAAKCKSLGGVCQPERCSEGYYPMPGIACEEGQVCCQAEKVEEGRV